MKEEHEISQEDLNNEIQNREKEEYYEDKLLELKMKSFLDDYIINHELSKYKNELDDLNKEKESLLNEKDILVKKISELEEQKNNYEDTLNDLVLKISEADQVSKDINSQIMSHQKFITNLQNEDNLVNHIIKTFPEPFKKKIYEFCSKNVSEALNNNNSNKKSENKTQNNKNTKGNNLMMVTSDREEFVSKGEQTNNNDNNNNNSSNTFNPMMGNYFMYPMYMMPPGMQNLPHMPNMTNADGNPIYFYPFPIANMQPNNVNKKK